MSRLTELIRKIHLDSGGAGGGVGGSSFGGLSIFDSPGSGVSSVGGSPNLLNLATSAGANPFLNVIPLNRDLGVLAGLPSSDITSILDRARSGVGDVRTNQINNIKASLTLTEEDKKLAIAEVGTNYLISIGMDATAAGALTELIYNKSAQDVGAKGFTWENFKEEGADALLNIGQGVVTGTALLAAAFGANSAGAQALGEMESWLGGLMSDESKTDKQRIGEIMAEAKDQPWFEQLKIAGRAFAVDPASMVLNALGTTIPALAGAALAVATAPASLPAAA